MNNFKRPLNITKLIKYELQFIICIGNFLYDRKGVKAFKYPPFHGFFSTKPESDFGNFWNTRFIHDKRIDFWYISIDSFNCHKSYLFELKSCAFINSSMLSSMVMFILLFLTRTTLFR